MSDAPETAEHLQRVSVAAIDEILGVPLRVLDNGFVRVVDYMGSDAAIVQAARVSYGAGTKRVQDDTGLIRYLLRHRHTTPFEMCEIKFHVRVPMDTWRQWIRHRTANVNEYSTRYSIAIDAAQRTAPEAWRRQSPVNRQGSTGLIDPTLGSELTAKEASFQQASRSLYEERLALGVAREQARKDLPLSTYTEAYWKIDLHNLLHFLSLRMDDHSQSEIRQYAGVIGHQIVAKWCPIAWQAYLDYQIGGLHLSEVELGILQALLRNEPLVATQLARDAAWLSERGEAARRNRERDECDAKLLRLGITPPWHRP